MYQPGNLLYLTLQTLIGDDLPDDTVLAVDTALRARSPQHHKDGGWKETDHPVNLVTYKMRILHAFKPFTMAVVCHVRLIGIVSGSIAPAVNDVDTATELGRDQATPLAIEGDFTDHLEYIVKIYDRRYIHNPRIIYDNARPYSAAKATAYHKLVQAGAPLPNFTRNFCQTPGLASAEHWTDVEDGLFEAWLEHECGLMRRVEIAAYNTLSDLQGKSVPWLFDAVSFASRTLDVPEGVATAVAVQNSEDKSGWSQGGKHDSSCGGEMTIVEGLLLEYIPGPSLQSYVDGLLSLIGRVPCHLFAKDMNNICDEAVRLVREVGKRDILNRDYRIDNIIVRAPGFDAFLRRLRHLADGVSLEALHAAMFTPLPRESPSPPATVPGTDPADSKIPRCVLIDFGHSRVRFPDETDEQWRCAKDLEDEEGAIGTVLQSYLKRKISALKRDSRPAALDEALDSLLWNWTVNTPWRRELSAEEQRAYEVEEGWGMHPNWRY